MRLHRTPQWQRKPLKRKVVVVGAGTAGLTCAARLKELGAEVIVFEKSRGVSGRMASRRMEHGFCDHGAQYFTARSDGFLSLVLHWQALGLVTPWNARIARIGFSDESPVRESQRFIGVPRMTSPMAMLAEGLDVRLNTRISKIERMPVGWSVTDESGETCATEIDQIVLAIPPAQALHLLGAHSPAWREQLAAVRMAPCWTVMATVRETDQTGFDAAFVANGPLAWVANNATKPGRTPLPVWTLHASAEWSTQHIDRSGEAVSQELIQAFEEIASVKVIESVSHRWLYARAVDETRCGPLWDPSMGLAACGDWTMGDNVEAAWRSGLECADRVSQ